jgi:hypothetical protein
MGDPENIPGSHLPEASSQPAARPELEPPVELIAGATPQPVLPQVGHAVFVGGEEAAARRKSFRHNLLLLLSLALAAFVMTSWILVRVDSPFGMFSTGPQDLVRAQLRALDRGELRPAYDMFSPRYRGQVSFETWHELCMRHWRMFHASVVRTETTSQFGPGATMEIFLHGSDDKDYRARFTLIHSDGRWWIDDVHWTEEADARDVSRT